MPNPNLTEAEIERRRKAVEFREANERRFKRGGGDKNGNNSSSGGSGTPANGCFGSGGGGSRGAQGIGIRKNGNTVTVTNNGTLGGNPAQQV